MDLQEPLLSKNEPEELLKSGDWPSEAAENAKLFVPPSWREVDDDATCVLTYDARDKLLYIKTDDSDRSTLDVIDPRDIIGANLEIKLFGPSDALTHVGFRNDKARTVPSEEDVNQSLIDKHDGTKEEESKCDIFKPLGQDMDKLFALDNTNEIPFDTQATAILNIYCYPRQHPSLKSWGNWFGLSSFKPTTPNPNPPTPVDNMGPRYAHHRRFEVVKSEDFADSRTLVRAIREVAELGHCLAEQDVTPRYLVFVNPAGGQKKAKSIYDSIVEPMLEQACVDHDLVVTTHARHAEEYMIDLNVDRYNGIIVVGGDGLIHEALQGIRKRPDAPEVLKKLKLGVVGGGSSNGLAKSILHESKELYSPLESTFMICKGQTCSLDLSEYKTRDNSYISFLTFSYAMIADIDIDSEVLRCLGALRFDLWGAYLGIRLYSYAVRLSYLPVSKERNADVVELPALENPVPSTWTTIEDDIVLLWVSQVSHASATLMSSPSSSLQSGVFHIKLIR
jgi:hypothetical protein